MSSYPVNQAPLRLFYECDMVRLDCYGTYQCHVQSSSNDENDEMLPRWLPKVVSLLLNEVRRGEEVVSIN